jgi:hypothetical protein
VEYGVDLHRIGEVEFDDQKIRFINFGHAERTYVMVIKFHGGASSVEVTRIQLNLVSYSVSGAGATTGIGGRFVNSLGYKHLFAEMSIKAFHTFNEFVGGDEIGTTFGS